MFELPDWINKETWADYEQMRRLIKKPLTDRGRRIAVKRLGELVGQNFNPEEVLEQSIFMCWQGLFPISGYGRSVLNTVRSGKYATDEEMHAGQGPLSTRRVTAAGMKKINEVRARDRDHLPPLYTEDEILRAEQAEISPIPIGTATVKRPSQLRASKASQLRLKEHTQ